MDEHLIHGPLDALQRLAELVDGKIADLEPGQGARLRDECAPDAPYCLIFEQRSEDFDPASADPYLR